MPRLVPAKGRSERQRRIQQRHDPSFTLASGASLDSALPQPSEKPLDSPTAALTNTIKPPEGWTQLYDDPEWIAIDEEKLQAQVQRRSLSALCHRQP